MQAARDFSPVVTYINVGLTVGVAVYLQKQINSLKSDLDKARGDLKVDLEKTMKMLQEAGMSFKDMDQRHKAEIDSHREIHRKLAKIREKDLRRIDDLEMKVQQLIIAAGDKFQQLPQQQPLPPTRRSKRDKLSDSENSDDDLMSAVKDVGDATRRRH